MGSHRLRGTLAAAFAAAVLLASCGDDDTTTLDIDGSEVTLPSELEDAGVKEGAIGTVNAILEQSGYTDSVRACIVEHVSQLPDSRFEEIPDLPEDERQAAGLAISTEAGQSCIKSTTAVLKEDATPEQLDLFRVATSRQLVTLFVQGGLEAELAQCMANRFESLSDPDVIQHANATLREQRVALEDWARDCQ